MKFIFYFSFLIALNGTVLFAQSYESYFTKPNTYRSTTNPYYWKNKKTNPGYWQQDVHYKIHTALDDSADVLDALFYELTYWNNSPDTLREMYFHIYQDAFRPGSYYHELSKENHVAVKFGKKEEQGLTTIVSNVTVNGQSLKIIQDNTVFKIILSQALIPGDSVQVHMNFKTWFDTGSMRRRMKTYSEFNSKHFDGVHWYPTVCVYDAHSGWNTDQDLDKEYYNEFGTFDIALQLPQEYICDGTGEIVNYKEVLPDSLRAALDLKNFAKKPYGEKPSIVIPKEKGKTKTWIFHAENVHNFAFTTDPTYRIGQLEWQGIKVITLAQEHHAIYWQSSGAFTLRVIQIYSRDFGQYAWPKIIIADAKDGMEYPMLTLDGGTYPQHQGLLAHEVGHMWFYGMVGSNETYRASLDEGFTQFLTAWVLDDINGKIRERKGPNKFISKYIDPIDNDYLNLYLPYLNHVTENFDEPLNTHSSAFNGALRHGGNYGLVYYKTGVMLYNLKQVLGDELFLKAMKHYVAKWSMAHPYPDDFRQAIIESSGTDLNWFFDQWLETTKYIDYKVGKIKKHNVPTGYAYDITLKRKGRMQMPLEVLIQTKDKQNIRYYIPNTWFVKPRMDSILPKWYGWDLLKPTYTFKAYTSSPLQSVTIDPDRQIADIDLSNNQKGKTNFTKHQFDHRIPLYPEWKGKKVYWRPDVWYQQQDGVMLGIHTEGSYYRKYNYSLSVWGNTTLGQVLPENFHTYNQSVAWNWSYKRNLSLLSKQLYHTNAFSYNAGIWMASAGLEKMFRKQDQNNPKYTLLGIQAKYLINETSTYDYQLYRYWGDVRKAPNSYINATLNTYLLRKYTYAKGNGTLRIELRTPFVASDYNYNRLTLESINKWKWKKLDISSRIYAQAANQSTPFESMAFVQGASPESMVNDKFSRTRTFFPANTINSSWLYQPGGGMNLRGFAGEVLTEKATVNGRDTTLTTSYTASTAAWNAEIDLDELFHVKAMKYTKPLHLDVYLFYDVALLQSNRTDRIEFSKVYADAGIGSALNIKFSPYDITPLVIRCDMPLWLSESSTNFKAGSRFILGINRAF
ncbi:MAG: pepN [Chitinophagaceae bacterium]|nr:pepN [Chitinophagaceae bacterium]